MIIGELPEIEIVIIEHFQGVVSDAQNVLRLLKKDVWYECLAPAPAGIET